MKLKNLSLTDLLALHEHNRWLSVDNLISFKEHKMVLKEISKRLKKIEFKNNKKK